MADVLDKRLVWVTGKGGVGKSTVAAALGLVAARRGRRTIVVEVARQEQLARAFARDAAGFHETELRPGLSTISIDPQQAMEEYIELQVRLKPLADILSNSRAFNHLAAAAPGLRELVTVGKIWELAQLDRRVKDGARYDLVIVDAPATGHGVAMLRAPKTIGDIARVGPVAHQAATIHAMLTDGRRTGVVAVALPEDMPVSETFTLRDRLRSDMGIGLDRVFVNALYPDRFGPRDETALRRALENGHDPVERAALSAALSARVRAEAQREQVERLREGLRMDPVELPFVFAAEFDLSCLGVVADAVEAGL